MPNINEYTDQTEWMGVCVPKRVDEGDDNDQAVAACMGMWEHRNDAKSVKAGNDWTLEVLGVPFGSPSDKDSDGQYFDANTNTHQEQYPTVPAVYFHGRDPDGKPINPEYIGKATPLRTDERGAWYQVALDKTKELAQRVWQAAKDGIARASSGSAPHLVRTDGDRITEWPVIELSVFDMGEGRQPSNRYAVAMPMMKAMYKQAGIDLPSEIQPEASESAADNATQSNIGVIEMDEKEVKEQIALALKAQREADAQALEAAKLRQAEIDAEVAKQLEAVKAEAAKGRGLLHYDEAPYVTQFNDSKYDELSAGELSLGMEVIKARGQRVPERMVKSLALKILDEKPQDENHEKDLRYVKASMPAQMRDEKNLKADVIMGTLDTANGLEWVSTSYSSELWRVIRNIGGLVGKIPSQVIPDGSNNIYIPLESTDPTWYLVAEATAVTSSTIPTATVDSSLAVTDRKNIAVAKVGSRVIYSGELTEDSIVQFAPQLREQMQVSGQEMLEDVILNGDTTLTTNINYSGNPADTFPTMALDGFRHLALVTNTANSRAGGSLSVEDYIETLKLMGTAGMAGADNTKVSFIVDANTHWANMKLPEVLTKDVYSSATLENGFLTRVFGVEILPSWQMHKSSAKRMTLSTGFVSDTDNSNLYGAILAVRWDQWKFVFKRRMRMEVTRFANSDSWEIVSMARFGMGYRDTEAAAISYGLSV